jgi:hypothetical protein
MQSFSLNGEQYSVAQLNEDGIQVLDALIFIELQLVELKNQKALLNKAKNSYIQDLSMEVVNQKSGLSLDTLFLEE